MLATLLIGLPAVKACKVIVDAFQPWPSYESIMVKRPGIPASRCPTVWLEITTTALTFQHGRSSHPLEYACGRVCCLYAFCSVRHVPGVCMLCCVGASPASGATGCEESYALGRMVP